MDFLKLSTSSIKNYIEGKKRKKENLKNVMKWEIFEFTRAINSGEEVIRTITMEDVME
jgi:hypothetical protein